MTRYNPGAGHVIHGYVSRMLMRGQGKNGGVDSDSPNDVREFHEKTAKLNPIKTDHPFAPLFGPHHIHVQRARTLRHFR